MDSCEAGRGCGCASALPKAGLYTGPRHCGKPLILFYKSLDVSPPLSGLPVLEGDQKVAFPPAVLGRGTPNILICGTLQCHSSGT